MRWLVDVRDMVMSMFIFPGLSMIFDAISVEHPPPAHTHTHTDTPFYKRNYPVYIRPTTPTIVSVTVIVARRPLHRSRPTPSSRPRHRPRPRPRPPFPSSVFPSPFPSPMRLGVWAPGPAAGVAGRAVCVTVTSRPGRAEPAPPRELVTSDGRLPAQSSLSLHPLPSQSPPAPRSGGRLPPKGGHR